MKKLAAAEDREGFLAGADAEMVGLMRQLSGEDADDGDSSGQEEEDTADWIQELTQMALAGDSGTAEQIDALVAKASEEVKGSDDYPIMKGYFRFLKELAAAGDYGHMVFKPVHANIFH